MERALPGQEHRREAKDVEVREEVPVADQDVNAGSTAQRHAIGAFDKRALILPTVGAVVKEPSGRTTGGPRRSGATASKKAEDTPQQPQRWPLACRSNIEPRMWSFVQCRPGGSGSQQIGSKRLPPVHKLRSDIAFLNAVSAGPALVLLELLT
jgi:hypothetical protein